MYIILAIIAFGVLIFVHELGHFTAAKACGVKVTEFAMGMGPQLLHFQRGETTYSLRALPVGGFCAMEGEEEHSDDPRAFNNQSVPKRLAILAAGSFMNFLLGFVLLLILYAPLPAPSSPAFSRSALTRTLCRKGIRFTASTARGSTSPPISVSSSPWTRTGPWTWSCAGTGKRSF